MTCWCSGLCAAIVLVAEGDACVVKGDQAPVRDGDPMGVAGEIGEYRFGAGEGRLGIDHPPRVSDAGRRTKVPEERTRGVQSGSYGDLRFMRALESG